MELRSVIINVSSILAVIISGSSAGKNNYNAPGYKNESSVSIDVISVPKQLGNGLFWDEEVQKLYFVDLLGRMAYRYDPSNSRTTSVSLDDAIAFIIPIQGESNQFLITAGTNLALMTWNGESSQPSNVEILTSAGLQINDGTADAVGRLWAGTIGIQEGSVLDLVPNAGNVFSFSPSQRNINVKLRGLTFPNDIAFSLDNEYMYLAESDLRVIYVFDYDIRKGDISNQRILFDFQSYNISGFPDGLAVDAENKLWVACFGAGQVIRIDPSTSKLLKKVNIPSLQVTSLTFGGRYLNELFVTSANIEQTPEQQRQYPYPGRTFQVTGLRVKGVPGQRVVL